MEAVVPSCLPAISKTLPEMTVDSRIEEVLQWLLMASSLRAMAIGGFFFCIQWLLLLLHPMVAAVAATFVASLEGCPNRPPG